MEDYEFVVITKVQAFDGTENSDGNLYDDVAVKFKNRPEFEKCKYVALSAMNSDLNTKLIREMPQSDWEKDTVKIQLPVFYLGEILIVDKDCGREIIGRGRKPGKWFVEYETFATIEEAIKKAKEFSDY